MILFLLLIVTFLSYLLLIILERQIDKLFSVALLPTFSITGEDIAKQMIKHNHGNLQISIKRDKVSAYYPTDSKIILVDKVYNGQTIAAWSSSCHEVGHLSQDLENYRWFKLNNNIEKIHTVLSYIFLLMIIISGIFSVPSKIFIYITGLYILLMVIYIPNLIMESNASKRAMKYLENQNITVEEVNAGWRMSRLTFMTYLIGFFVPHIQICIKIINKFFRRN